jgi:hypothetical protein
MQKVSSWTVGVILLICWVGMLPASAQTTPIQPISLARSDQDIVVLQYQDIFDEFDRVNGNAQSAERRTQFREYKLARYASRKAEFIAAAAARGVTAVDTFPEFPMLSLPRDTPVTSLVGIPWLAYVAPDWDMHLHLMESRDLINKHLLRGTFPEADRLGKLTGKGTTLMILDTGVDYLLKDLGGCVGKGCKVVVAKDFTLVDDNERDPNRHGTNVAAIAAGTSGIAQEAHIIAGDIMDAAGKISTKSVVNAIGWAIENRDVYNIVAINMSFGGGPYHEDVCTSSAYDAPVAEARRNGIIVVASAGNDFNPKGMPEPACVRHVISVGAVFDGGYVDPAICDSKHPVDEVTCFSNSSQATSLLAPGAQITAGGESMSGTSQAAPHVTGAIAVLRGMEPGLTVTQVENRLRDTGIPIVDKRNNHTLARLDLVALLQDSLKRPLPLPLAQEWWRTGEVDGKQLPVLTDPWFDTLRASMAGHYDQATNTLWSQPDPAIISAPVTLRAAQNYCRRRGTRLPTRHEMDSIQDVRRLAPTINVSVLTGAVSGPYWTITPARGQGASNWVINLSDGRAYEVNAADSYANFFCVLDLRGDPPAVQYVDQGATIKDNATGLVWQKGTVSADDYHTLADACVGSAVDEKNWRVPTWKELSTLLSAEHEAPYVDPLFTGETALASSTPAVKRGLDFRFVNFQNGISGAGMLSATRCVEQALLQPVQPGRIFKGNVRITGPDHILGSRALQQFESGMYAVIQGDLEIMGVESASIILPYLRKVTGSLVVSKTSAGWVSLPALETVGGSLEVVGNAKLDSLWMPSLIAVEGAFIIESNPQLGVSQPFGDLESDVAVGLPGLSRIGGDFRLKYNAQLKSITLHRLRAVGRGIDVVSNISMSSLVLDSLGSVGLDCRNHTDFCGDLSIYGNLQLMGAFFPALATIQYDLRISGNTVLKAVGQRVDSVSGLYADSNKSLCERETLDPIMSRMWRLRRFPDVVSIDKNSLEEGCRSLCPNKSDGVCKIIEKAP